ncbi:MAG: cyclic pyranopterin monophosphate synthase MoaC [Deltaproteobacteria bacterium]|nr:cyclic pyranopterin monophosphate synthase MoaC [Deltaproteobacteria bacterium]
MTALSHLDSKGKAKMVDVTAKTPSVREAVAAGVVVMLPETAALISSQGLPKGDVFGVAKIAAIMAAKKTGDLIPLCHPLELTDVDVRFECDVKRGEIRIEAKVKSLGRTGVEMEAMTAVSMAALTIYDMCKAADRGMVISEIKLMEKRGGKSGVFVRKG